MRPQPRLFVFNDPHPMRIDGALAAEIGLEESIVLLQLEYLISISTAPEHEGRRWTYQSLQGLHDHHFPWWSVTTIGRIIKSLEAKQLVIVATYNKKGYDRTRWYAINHEGIGKLHSIAIYQNDKSIVQNDKSIVQSGDMEHAKMNNATLQIEPPIPETPTEITHKKNSAAPSARARSRKQADAAQAVSDSPPSEDNALPRRAAPKLGPIATALVEVCRIDTLVATKALIIRVHKTAKILSEAGYTPEQIAHFGRWWLRFWRGEKGTAPQPEDVQKHWGDAMSTYRAPAAPEPAPAPEPERQRATRADWERVSREVAERRGADAPDFLKRYLADGAAAQAA